MDVYVQIPATRRFRPGHAMCKGIENFGDMVPSLIFGRRYISLGPKIYLGYSHSVFVVNGE
jgi:hypothetical protein